jgi:hypothetical protein
MNSRQIEGLLYQELGLIPIPREASASVVGETIFKFPDDDECSTGSSMKLVMCDLKTHIACRKVTPTLKKSSNFAQIFLVSTQCYEHLLQGHYD